MEMRPPAKLLVTGADGYIGSVLAPLLLERGYDVTGLDTGYYRDGWLYTRGNGATPRCITKDIRCVTESDLAGFDALVHLAELSNDPLGQLSPETTFKINHQGSVHLARLCKRVGIRRFVYTSSCSVYGVGSGDFKTEDSATCPQTPYAECKVLVERDLGAMADDDFSPTFLRNATAYGPSPRMRFDIVLNNLAGLAWTTREIAMTSDGTPWRPLVHVADICEAIACVLEAPREAVHGQILNVGDTAENYQVRDIAGFVAEAFPGCRLSFGRSDGDNRSYRVSFDRIRRVLPAFRCRRTVATGAAEIRRLFERIALSAETFQFRAFTRLRQLEHLVRTGQIDRDFLWT
jgi:nucleoside-diphosphate-sugar epimerase